MPNTNPKSLNRASNPDYFTDADGSGDVSGAAEQRSTAIAKAVEGEATDPGGFDARQAAKAALANALKG